MRKETNFLLEIYFRDENVKKNILNGKNFYFSLLHCGAPQKVARN